MSTFEFGDFVVEDAADIELPDPVATSRIYQNYRENVYRETSYDALSPESKALLAYIFVVVISIHYALTAEAGAIVIITLARKFSGDQSRKPWSKLIRREKSREIVAAEYILKRLARETDTPWDRD